VLKSVIEQENIGRRKLREQNLSGFIAVGADADGANLMPQKNLRFVSGVGGGDLGSGRKDQIARGRAAPVAAGENCRRVAAFVQLRG
jgi:hypothetical protein